MKEHGLNIELVIVDDCSTDGSYQIAQELAAKYEEVTVVRHEKIKGKGLHFAQAFSLPGVIISVFRMPMPNITLLIT